MHMLSMYIEPCPHVITYVLLKGQSSRYSCPVEGGTRILGVRIREVLLYTLHTATELIIRLEGNVLGKHLLSTEHNAGI